MINDDVNDKQSKQNIKNKKFISKSTSFISSLIKSSLYLGFVFGSYFVGEFYQPAHKLHDLKQFYNRSVEGDNLCNYNDFKVIPVINKNGCVETYFGNVRTNSFHRIKNDNSLDTVIVKLGDNYINNFWRK